LTALIVSASGWFLSLYVPGAHSVGDVIIQLKHASP
jgi:hypothetical protein